MLNLIDALQPLAALDSPASSALLHRRMGQMLDAIDYGMLLMADGQRVAHANKAARRELDAHHPLQLQGELLLTRLDGDTVPLRDAVEGAARRGLRRLLSLGLPDDPRGRVSVAVVPLAPLGHEPLHGVALLLGKRQVCEELTVDWYARTHGLTMAETAVIKGLCADLTPQQIAARQGVGLATIRTQIGAIRTKTGASSIRALVQQVALLPPLVSALQPGSAQPAGPHGVAVAQAANALPLRRAAAAEPGRRPVDTDTIATCWAQAAA